jgi:hypothetical protein
MPAAPGIHLTYSRLTTTTATAGGGETRLLSPGSVLALDYRGSLQFGANTLFFGDAIRVFAWGTYVNTAAAAGAARIRMYQDVLQQRVAGQPRRPDR